jgi:GMP reductase
MSSREAMDRHSGGVADYRAPEGKLVSVAYKGLAEGVVQEVLGGLRSACSYVGAMKLKDLSKCTTFVKVRRIHESPF